MTTRLYYDNLTICEFFFGPFWTGHIARERKRETPLFDTSQLAYGGVDKQRGSIALARCVGVTVRTHQVFVGSVVPLKAPRGTTLQRFCW